MITLIYRHWRPRNLPNWCLRKHHQKKVSPSLVTQKPHQKRHDGKKNTRHLLNKVMQFASQLRQRLGTGPLSHLEVEEAVGAHVLPCYILMVYASYSVLYHRHGGVFRCLCSLYELARRQISWGSWLTLSEYDWGVQPPPKCKVFRFHKTIPEKVIDWIPRSSLWRKEDLGPKTVLRQG